MKLRTPLHVSLMVAGLSSLTSFGCSDDDAPEDSRVRQVDYELFPSTHELSPADVASISSLSPNGELRFERLPESLTELRVGEVLLAGVTKTTPNGLLRVVLDIQEEDDGAVTLRTGAAPLQMAFRRLRARVADNALPFARGGKFTGTDVVPLSVSPQFSVAGDLGDTQTYEILAFDGDGNPATKNDQVAVDATLGGGVRYDLSLDVDWGTVERLPTIVTDCLTSVLKLTEGELPSCKPEDLLPELKLGLAVEPHLEASVAVSGAASVGFEESLDIGTIALPPITVGPLVLVPNVDIIATIAGRASARFDASAHANISVRSSVLLSSKVENSELVPFELGETDADAETPEVDLYAEISAKPGARLVLALYGVLGPYAQLSAAATLRANPLESPCWDFRVGLETELGVLVKTPSLPGLGALTFLDWNTGPVPLWDTSVASGDCELTEEGQQTPPGGGPTAELLQQPSFKPWAKLMKLPADGAQLESILAYPTGFPFLTPTVDGRYVAGGGGARGLLKLDGDGNATWQSALFTDSDAPMLSLGSVPSGDAGLLTLYRGSTDAFVLAKQTQSGALVRAVSVTLPDECGAVPQALVQRDGGGALVFGECPFTRSAWLVEMDDELSLLESRELVDTDATTTRLMPTTATRQDGEWVLAGQLTRVDEDAGSLGFLTRLSKALDPGVSSAFACPERLSFYPTAVIPSAAGSVTLVGDAAGLGYVARVKADGSLGFARFPNLGGGVQSGFSPNAVVELPTTGLVVASTVDGEGENPTDVVLLGLDGNGFTLWGREYLLHGEAGLRAIGFPSALLTDDGGVLLSATAGPEGDSEGELLAFKVFARDGSLSDESLLSSVAVTPDESEVAVEPRDFSPTLRAIAVSVNAFSGHD
ncbi:MAG: hypothetical protein K0R38_2456 [Polyangiaceae bacterium]|jgi:hypothetical protein|nr:hypothetical protein [Polyangiaceae bacterium]